jgi:8-oxo-dGTP diphosphatase
MLSKIVVKLWKKAPRSVRGRIVRATQKTFTASAGAIVTNSRGEVLLLDHYLRPSGGWGIPGGFMNYGEQPEEALGRELMEEVGLELKNIKLLRARTIERHIEFLFAAEAEGEPEVLSREIRAAGWFAPGEFPAGMSSKQKSMIENYLKYGASIFGKTKPPM